MESSQQSSLGAKVLVIATQNQHKASEIQTMLTPILRSTGIQLRTLSDYPRIPDIEEVGTTLQENAELKARETLNLFQKQPYEPKLWGILSDDSGLCVSALNGAPGVYSARYAEKLRSGLPPQTKEEHDQANRTKLLAALQTMRKLEHRKASFVTCLVILVAGQPSSQGHASSSSMPQIFQATGSVNGWISHHERGTYGFGYDSIFVPQLPTDIAPSPNHSLRSSILETGKTFAQMPPTEKNAFSHRRRALTALIKTLKQELSLKSSLSKSKNRLK